MWPPPLSSTTLKESQQHNTPNTLHPRGKTITKNCEIAKKFANYYSSLYDLRATDPSSIHPSKRTKDIKAFLGQFSLTKLPDENSASLESPITLEEWEQAIKQLKPGKSPGPDGISAVYYKTFADILETTFLDAFKSLSPSNRLHKEC